MKKRLLLMLFLGLNLLFLACDDDDSDDGAAGAGGEAGSAQADTGAAGSDAGAGGETDAGGGEADMGGEVPAEGACTNDADKVIVDDPASDVTGKATQCGLGCMGDADPATCSTPCVVNETGLSEACSACYAQLIACTVEKCLAQCAGGLTDGCIQCQRDQGCSAPYYECSGNEPSAK